MNIGFLWGTESIIAGFIRSIFGFFLGLLLFRHHEDIERKIGATSNTAWFAVIGIILILCSPDAGNFNWIIDFVSVTAVFPFLVIYASQGKTTRLQSLLLILGSASYPIYVLHKPFGEIFGFIFKSSVGLYAPISGFLFTLVLIVISVLIEKHFDIPLRKRMSKKLI